MWSAVRRRHSSRLRNRIIGGKVWQDRRFWCIVPMKIITPFTDMSEKNWKQFLEDTEGRTGILISLGRRRPRRRTLQSGFDRCDKLIKERAEKLEIIHSNPEAYFKERKAAKTSYPVVEKSLNPVAEGCYTSQVRVKQKHRLLENEILVGEKMATQAELLYGTKYPKEEIHEAVRALLFSEFHDALPGSGTQQVEEDTLRLLDHGLELMSRVNCRSAIALTAGEAPIKEGSSCAFLCNPHPYPITGQFAFEVGLPKQNWDPCFYHPRASVNGEEVPTQSEMECSHFCIDWRKRVVVEATLKPCAMNRVDVWFDAIEKRPTFERISRKENFVFDNGKMRIEINPRTGLVDSWKVGDTEYLKPGSFCPVAIDGTYNSWGLWKNEPERAAFTLLTDHEGSEFSGLYEQIEPSVRVIEDGKVRYGCGSTVWLA